jgi:pimeloyl-ACP methyl ester carboxylesterase
MHLHTETLGSGDPVLFLHGITGSVRTYGWLERDGAIRLDFRGHGESDRAPGTYRIADYVADAVSVLESLDRPAALVGHSLGGVVAWSVAQLRPDLVTRAFIEDPPLYMGEAEEHAANPAVAIAAQTRDAIGAWQHDGTDVEALKAQLAAMPLSDAMYDDALEARAYAWLRLDLEVFDRLIDGSLLDGTDTSSPITVPVLILAADPEQSAFAPEHEARLAASHPDVEVVRLPGAGHSIHDERAHRDEYARRLDAFL